MPHCSTRREPNVKNRLRKERKKGKGGERAKEKGSKVMVILLLSSWTIALYLTHAFLRCYVKDISQRS